MKKRELRRLLEDAELEVYALKKQIIDPLKAPIHPLIFKTQLEELADAVRKGERWEALEEWLPLLRYCSRHLSSAVKEYEKKIEVEHTRLPKHKPGQSPAELRMMVR